MATALSIPLLHSSHIIFLAVSDLDTLRAETQNANEKSASAATQTAAMLSLNFKLQTTASKNHAKQIELEVKTIEAREVKELLTIIQVIRHIYYIIIGALLMHSQPYLPDVYMENDSDATSFYMFFQRLAAKTDLINTVVAQTHGLPDSLNGSVSDMLVGVCEVCTPFSRPFMRLVAPRAEHGIR